MSGTKDQRPDASSERQQLDHFVTTLRSTASTSLSRRDLARMSALAAGAVATARFGVQSASAAPSAQDDPQTDQELLIPFDPYGEPVVLDPHQAVNWGPFWLLLPNVFGGLLRFSETGAVEYDLAESYEVSDDGKTYTFRIRSDARYANGTPVIADHFVQSWKRALNPDSLSPMAEFMSIIEGYGDYTSRASEDLGVEATDDQTLTVTLTDAYAFFPSYAASFVYAVVDPAVLESNPDDFYLNDAGTGPWRVTAFDPGGDLVMEPNTEYYGGQSPSLTRLTWRTLSGSDAGQAALDLYTNEDAISADVTISLIEAVQADEALSADLRTVEASGTTRALAMDFAQEPFNSVGVRRAFALAVDRDTYCNDTYLGTYAPTTSFTPPVTAIVANGYEAPEGIAFNADDAASALADAGFEGGAGLPEIVFYQSSGTTDEEIARTAAFLATFADTLGVTITHDTSLTAAQLELQREDNNGIQIGITDWTSIGDTPYLLSYALRPGSQYMDGFFNWNVDLEDEGDLTPGADAQQFLDLTDDADREQDPAARNDLYQQAEALALQNAVYVPIGNWVQQYVQKPWLQGTRQGAWSGRLPILFDQNVTVVGR